MTIERGSSRLAMILEVVSASTFDLAEVVNHILSIISIIR